MSTFFISIAAFRDSELPHTVSSCVKNADHPENLHIGIVDQSTLREIYKIPIMTIPERPEYLRKSHIESIWFPSKSAKGAGWARAHAQSMYAGEDFFLQIDSHTRFDEGWDTTLIRAYHEAMGEALTKDVILSAFPKAYVREGQKDTFFSSEKYPSHPTKQDILWAGKKVWSAKRVEFDDPYRKVPEESQTVLAGFIFAPGWIVKDIPYDPQISFFGEELCYALRAWTRGYKIYSPNHMPISHFYTRPHHHKIWDAGNNSDKKWGGLEKKSMDRQAAIYRGDILGTWGAPDKQSLNKYFEFVNTNIAAVYDEMLSNRNKESNTYKEQDIGMFGFTPSLSIPCIDDEHVSCGVEGCECPCHPL